jgi:hypothetical protein
VLGVLGTNVNNYLLMESFEVSADFSIFSSLPKVIDMSMLTLLVPLRALPQSTHYVLDGFIWKLKSSEEK